MWHYRVWKAMLDDLEQLEGQEHEETVETAVPLVILEHKGSLVLPAHKVNLDQV